MYTKYVYMFLSYKCLTTLIYHCLCVLILQCQLSYGLNDTQKITFPSQRFFAPYFSFQKLGTCKRSTITLPRISGVTAQRQKNHQLQLA